MLVPTTILAQQHYGTFAERLKDYPFTIEHVSRFRSAAEQKKAIAGFQTGAVDILIGTHRLLSRDVRAKDLGLIIVDEEQRFGVKQKELLRQLKLRVDVISMSATPIPRTLQMSLAGLRDISVIETPPEGRRPVKTYVGEYDEELVKQALAARARARRPGVLPAQPRRDDRRDGRAPARPVPGDALRRRPRPDGGEASRGADADASCAARPTCSCARASSSRASTSRRRTRSSSTAPTSSACRSSTRSAGASAAAASARTRTCCIRARRR